jgi:hypothetical protein
MTDMENKAGKKRIHKCEKTATGRRDDIKTYLRETN